MGINLNIQKCLILLLPSMTFKMDGNYENAEHTYVVATLENIKTPIITEHYSLPDDIKKELLTSPTPFSSAYAECVFLRTYSRKKEDGNKESWAETVIRVIEGTMEAYLTHHKRNGLFVDYKWLTEYAVEMTRSFFHRQWSPPGRGLYAMGTDHTRKNGNAALNNCYACETKNLVLAASWAMDQLMCGGGVGFDCSWDGIAIAPTKEDNCNFVIPDTRQGWVAAVELLLRSYLPIDGEITNKFPKFDYSLIRPYGEPIRGFGGTASGPGPLKTLLERIEIFLDTYLEMCDLGVAYLVLTNQEVKDLRDDIFLEMADCLNAIGAYGYGDYQEEKKKLVEALKKYDKDYDKTRLVVDIFNSIGACVVAGNVRRSAEIAIGDAGDKTFLDLKNVAINPERASISWMSNNTVRFEKNEDFEMYIPEIAKRIQNNGEPGFFNLINAKRFGRYSDTDYGEDTGRLLNPCGEIILNGFEPCTLATVCPWNCKGPDGKIDMQLALKAAQYATFYATTVTCVKHHWGVSNAVIAHNRRIGVSLTGIADIYESYGFTYLTTLCRSLYKEIRSCNKQLAAKAGIPRAIRVTTVKPEGTLSIIMEVNAGVHFPICRFARRRIGIAKNDDLLGPLKEAGYPIEQSTYSESMVYVIFPIENGKCRSEREVSIYEQFGIVSALQRSYADNSVSFTGHFSEERESADVERVIAMFAPQIKACSMLPYSDDLTKKPAYAHMPFEEIDEKTYHQLKASIKPVIWNTHSGQDAVSQRGCNNDTCSI